MPLYSTKTELMNVTASIKLMKKSAQRNANTVCWL